jgi:hypothetical protein
MFKKTLLLAAILSILLACNAQGEVTYSTWVGGPSGQWEENDNWDPFEFMSEGPDNFTGLPGHSYVVTINKPPLNIDEVTIGLYLTHIIDRLDCYGKVRLENWSNHYVRLSIPPSNPPYPPDVNCLANHGHLEIYRLDIEGDIYNEIGARFINAEHGYRLRALEGSIYNHGSILCAPATDLWADHRFENFGVIEMSGGSCLSRQAFTNETTGVIHGFGTLYALGGLTENHGTISAQIGSLFLSSTGSMTNKGILDNYVGATLHILPSALHVNNQGTIIVNAAGSVVLDCNLVNEPNGIIKLLGGTLGATMITQKAGANFAGFGGITGNVIIESNGITKLTGPTNIVGDVEIKDDATLEVSDGLTLITGKTDCNDGTIYMKGGYVIPQGGLTGDCNIIWEPGLYTNVTDFNLDGQVNLKDFAYFADTWLWQTGWR